MTNKPFDTVRDLQVNAGQILAGEAIEAIADNDEKRLQATLARVGEDQAVDLVVALGAVAAIALKEYGGKKWRTYLARALEEAR